jgi:phthalate 4,5-dioxygenase oxygenase subunit
MKSQENDLLTEVGPGTPAGDMFRRYWHPVAMSSEVPTPDCDPVSLDLLGERLVVFRDTEGRVGVLSDRCMHRGVSLGLGRVEEGGIRCIYHGWKFDVEGNILDTPNHPVCSYRESKKATSYKAVEQSGIVWAYMGPADKEPPLRSLPSDTVPASQRLVFRSNAKSSYLSMWEGGVDSSHVGILHTNAIRPNWGRRRRGEEVTPDRWDSLAPTYDVQDMDYGFRYVAFRDIPGQDGKRQARLVPTMMPGIRVLPGEEGFDLVIIETPMGDCETGTYTILYSHDTELAHRREEFKIFLGLVPPMYDDATHNVLMEWPGKLFQNRASMDVSWSGYDGIKPEDLAMALSLSKGWDRSTENLVAADIAVMRLRAMLKKAIKVNASGGDPVGLDFADMTQVLPTDQTIDKAFDWKLL